MKQLNPAHVAAVKASVNNCPYFKTGKTLCLSEATVFDDKEKMPAHGTVTLMVLKSLEINGKAELPPKYLP